MARDYRDDRPRRRGCGCGCLGGLLGLLLVVAALLGVGEFALHSYATDRLREEATSRIGPPATVGFGPEPLLLTVVDHRIRTLYLTTDGSATVPKLDLSANDVTLRGATWKGLSVTGGTPVLGTVFGTATLTDAQLTAAAKDAGSDPLAALTAVRSVRSDPESGTLKVGLAVGAEVTVIPSVSDGRLVFTPREAEVLGVPIPGTLVQALSSAVSTRLDALPEGITADRATAVPGGLEIHLTGHDVVLAR